MFIVNTLVYRKDITDFGEQREKVEPVTLDRMSRTFL